MSGLPVVVPLILITVLMLYMIRTPRKDWY